MSDRVRRRLTTRSLVALCVPLSGAQAAAERACKLTLTVKEESFSSALNATRIWTASIDVDGRESGHEISSGMTEKQCFAGKTRVAHCRLC
jgi:hypothetical protein